MAPTEKTNNAPLTKPGVAKTPAEMPDKQRIAVLVVGDVLAFLAFAAIGRGSHGEASGFAAIPQIVLTALPFAAAWFIVAPLVGAYRRDLTADPRKMAKRTALAWLLSWPVAMALRGIFVDHGIPPLSFAIITLIFNTVILLIWRWPYALNNSIKKRVRA
ncbi:MAG: DUF3054 domain-containing protein [Ktedonobacteraceae bacterium]